jgi:hypothetical protein
MHSLREESARPSTSPTERFGFPFCTETVETPAVDPNGYQYGWDWELDESCRVSYC